MGARQSRGAAGRTGGGARPSAHDPDAVSGLLAGPGSERPDLIVTGAVATLAGDRGFRWAGAIAITGGRVVAAGEATLVEALAASSTRLVRLRPDEAVLPGLTDAHLHLGEAALAAERLDLLAAGSLEAAMTALAAWSSDHREPDRWIEGSGWDPARWGAWPSASDLERATPGRLIALWSHDHHALLLSPAALTALGIDRDIEDPPGGVVRRDDRGAPTGVLQERATELVSGRLGAVGSDRLDEAIERYAHTLLSTGIVAVHDPGPLLADPDLSLDMASCARLDAAARLPLRVHVCVREDSLETALARGLRSGDVVADGLRARGGRGSPAHAGFREPRCRVGWIKLFADGALGSRTAALLEPYEAPGTSPGSRHEAALEPAGWRGILTLSRARLRELTGRAAAGGIAAEVHAIGDAAVRMTLEVLGEAGPAAGDSGFRHRIEHLQLLGPGDEAGFARSGIGASVQPIHLRSDVAPARLAWGERADARGYPYRSLLDAGAVLAFGSDAPVETADPWAGLAYAVLRRAPGSSVAPFGAGQTIELADALRAACVGPPMLAGERDRGRLVPGQRADLLIVPLAPFAGRDAEAVAGIRPTAVLIDGEPAGPGLALESRGAEG